MEDPPEVLRGLLERDFERRRSRLDDGLFDLERRPPDLPGLFDRDRRPLDFFLSRLFDRDRRRDDFFASEGLFDRLRSPLFDRDRRRRFRSGLFDRDRFRSDDRFGDRLRFLLSFGFFSCSLEDVEIASDFPSDAASVLVVSCSNEFDSEPAIDEFESK